MKSVASVFEETESGNKWDSEDSDSNADLQERRLPNFKVNVDKLKLLSKTLNLSTTNEQFDPLMQSTPYSAHQMSGSTILNDFRAIDTSKISGVGNVLLDERQTENFMSEPANVDFVNQSETGPKPRSSGYGTELRDNNLMEQISSLPPALQNDIQRYIESLTPADNQQTFAKSEPNREERGALPKQVAEVSQNLGEEEEDLPSFDHSSDQEYQYEESYASLELNDLKHFISNLDNGHEILRRFDRLRDNHYFSYKSNESLKNKHLEEEKSDLFRRQQSEIIDEINIDDNAQTTKTIGPLLMPDAHAKIPANKKLYYRLGLDCVDDLSKVDLQNIVKVSFISVHFV
jgi:hypothetical protein